MPRLKGISFETAIIERYRRRESSVEEALIEMYPVGVSVRRVEDITEALWGSKVSPATISELNKKVYAHIEDWRNRPHAGLCPPAPCGWYPVGKQEVHEHEALGGCPRGRLLCWLTSLISEICIPIRA